MRTILCLLAFLLLLGAQLFAQAVPKHTINGYIQDASSGEKLLGATIAETRSRQGTTSNNFGFFSITLPQDSVRILISYIGYAPVERIFYLNKDTLFNISLGDATELAEVEISASKSDRIEENTQMSRIVVPIEQIEKIPALLGEVDVLKAIQLLPGVQKGSEGSSGFYVRGGSPDQNLILLDGVPVYNAFHLFGFFSVFNSDAIKDVELIKGGFPARYGGRLASVLDIGMKEGNLNELHGEGSVGLVAARLTLEGPIIKNKASFIVSGRRTYIDILAQPLILAGSEGDVTAGYYFQDFNAKINYRFNDRDRLYLSCYTGNDRFYAREKSDNNKVRSYIGWGNVTAAARWNHLFGNGKLFSNVTATYSRYKFDIFNKVTDNSGDSTSYFTARYLSGIEDVSLKSDFDWLPHPDHFVRFGANATFHTFRPGAFNFKSTGAGQDFDENTGAQSVPALESYIYIEDDWVILPRLKANIGFHGSSFTANGKSYFSAQPRASLRYLMDNGLAIKGSYSMMTQYIHLLSNEGIGFPTDLWVPSTAKVEPENAWQAALGLAYTLNDSYEFSIEGYYKRMGKVLSYAEGAGFFNASNWEDKVEQGKGESYGMEVFAQKKFGKLTGWVGYTLSWSWRQFDDINFGRRYPYRYDRRHDLSVVASYTFGERFRLSATWVYGTGNAVTLPNSQFPADYTTLEGMFGNSYTAEAYPDKNNYRMRAYHRFDIGFDFMKKTHTKRKEFTHKFSLGAYNLYSRKNPFYLAIEYKDPDNNGTYEKKLVQYSLFPIIPYLTYSFKF